MADDHGIPWQGKIPSDLKHFRQTTDGGTVLMGYGTYVTFAQPLSSRQNYVATTEPGELREGFSPVNDARKFLQNAAEDIWVIGGPGLFDGTFDLADRLYLTHLNSDFNCTKFFPPYEDEFELVDKSNPIMENDITFYFATYHRK